MENGASAAWLSTDVPDTTPVSGSANSASPPTTCTPCSAAPLILNTTRATSRNGRNPKPAAATRLAIAAFDWPSAAKCS